MADFTVIRCNFAIQSERRQAENPAVWTFNPPGPLVGFMAMLPTQYLHVQEMVRLSSPQAMKTGLPMTEAFRAVAREMPDPTRDEFHQATNAVAMGAPPDDALMQVYHRTRLAEYAIFAVTVAVHNRSGGRISESIQNLAETVRQRVSVAGRAQALSAEARLSARIMTVLPFVGGGLMTYMHPGYLAPLIDDPRGKHMLVVGATTLAIGAFAMRRLVNSVVRE